MSKITQVYRDREPGDEDSESALVRYGNLYIVLEEDEIKGFNDLPEAQQVNYITAFGKNAW